MTTHNVIQMKTEETKENLKNKLQAKKKIITQKQRDLKALIKMGQDPRNGYAYIHLLQELKQYVREAFPIYEEIYGKAYTHKTNIRQSEIHWSIKHSKLIDDFQHAGLVLAISYDNIQVLSESYVTALKCFYQEVNNAQADQKDIQQTFDDLLRECSKNGYTNIHFDMPVYLTKKQIKYINFQAHQSGIVLSFANRQIFNNKNDRMHFIDGLNHQVSP